MMPGAMTIHARWSVPVVLTMLALGCKTPPSPPPAEEETDRAAPLPTASAEIKATAAAATPAEPVASEPGSIPAPTDVAQPPADAKKTASGLAYKVLEPGKGKKKATRKDKVRVHYTGWTKDGKMFDSSVSRGEPASFAVTGVIPGWTEALQLMVEGQKCRLWIPANLAYGDSPRQPGAPSGQLTFDVELIEIIAPPAAPTDVAKPPPGAKKTTSGLAYKVLEPGKGKTHPTASSRVQVHYTGWTKDGEMFDSSLTRGSPATFSLSGVIPGWTEGVQLMVEGEKARFWIPGNLAYGDTPKRPGAPSGQLTFDIELIKIY